MDRASSRAHAYRSTVVDVTLRDGRTLSVRPRERPPGGFPLPFVVLTAWNPASRPRAAWVNTVDQALLDGVLQARGCETLGAIGRAIDGSWSEPSIAVWGLATEHALRLGGDFGQNAIFAVTDDGLQVLPCPLPDDEPQTVIDLPLYWWWLADPDSEAIVLGPDPCAPRGLRETPTEARGRLHLPAAQGGFIYALPTSEHAPRGGWRITTDDHEPVADDALKRRVVDAVARRESELVRGGARPRPWAS